MQIKVLKIRICSQCGDKLNDRCKACVKHPTRKPRIYYAAPMPEIFGHAECGNCVKVQCSYALCMKTFWRTKSTANKYETTFCDRPATCQQKQAALDINKQELKTCSNGRCDRGPKGTVKEFMCPQNRIRKSKNIYCCPSCWHIDSRVERIERMGRVRELASAARRKARLDRLGSEGIMAVGAEQTLECSMHARATTHVRLATGAFQCTEANEGRPCLTERSASLFIGNMSPEGRSRQADRARNVRRLGIKG